MNYILDSYALIALINKEVGSEIVSNLIQEGYKGKVSLYMSTINYGELLYQLPNKRFGNYSFESIEMRLNALPINYITPDIELVKESARIKINGNISYADCFAISLTKKMKGKVVTGDKEFQQFESLIDIIWL